MMLKLYAGEYLGDRNGGFQHVTGFDELLQRALMKLTARRGGFAMIPDFGSRLHLLSRESADRRETAASEYVHEALRDEELEIESIRLGGDQNGMHLSVTLSAESGRGVLEVPV